ncbi:MAG: DUF4097 family beta strand repeat protein [Clostridia bacterium]|nr:DUF4097 family beta strand repeat protein [Clostridia bacterium]
MTSFQKVIKYCATAFAIFLIVTIIGGAVTALLAISGVHSLKTEIKENKAEFSELKEYTLKSDEIDKLDIDVGAVDIIIEKGNSFTVKYSGINFDIDEEKNKLEIENDSDSIFGFDAVGKLLITVPDKMSFEKVSLCAGAGDIYIESLNCGSLDLDLGAGEVEIDYLRVKRDANIDGGAGELTISDGTINNPDISLGVGQTSITALLKGKSTVEAGVGELSLTLKGDKASYAVSAETGIGDFRVDGERVSDGDVIGSGESLVEIEGGIGLVRVEFAA